MHDSLLVLMGVVASARDDPDGGCLSATDSESPGSRWRVPWIASGACRRASASPGLPVGRPYDRRAEWACCRTAGSFAGAPVEEREHHIQDACELYAVAVLQSLAEDAGVALSIDSGEKMASFRAYAHARSLTDTDFDSGPWSAYKSSVDKHMPVFLGRLRDRFRGESFDFVDVEAASRNDNKKGDFLIVREVGNISVSLKNYRNGAARPQVCSGTFNSFILNFLPFPADGVGMFLDPVSGKRFKGSTVKVRDVVLDANGFGFLVPYLHELDELNAQIKARFVYADEFRFLDEGTFIEAARECGHAGAATSAHVLNQLDPRLIKARLIKMTGFDGSEELLLMDPLRMSDSITNERFNEIRRHIQDANTQLEYGVEGQGLRFRFVRNGDVLLAVTVPFTINKNGAWISGEPFDGARLHKKEGVFLSYGERRPKKSKELATSVNTYIDFDKAGIF